MARATDQDVVATDRIARAWNVLESHAGSVRQESPRNLRSEVLLRLDPDRFRMADQHRYAHARHGDRQVRQLQDLARFGAELHLFVEVLAVEVPIHVEVGLRRGRRAQLLHAVRAGARHRLVRAHAHACEARRVVQRLQRHRQWDGAAVRVRDDAVVPERAVAVYLGHDERDALLEPVGR